MNRQDNDTQTDTDLLQPLFIEWITYIQQSLPPPPSTYVKSVAPKPMEGPSFSDWFDSLEGDSFEVYSLKDSYEKTFGLTLSIFQFTALKVIRENFTKSTTGSKKNRQIIYRKRGF